MRGGIGAGETGDRGAPTAITRVGTRTVKADGPAAAGPSTADLFLDLCPSSERISLALPRPHICQACRSSKATESASF